MTANHFVTGVYERSHLQEINFVSLLNMRIYLVVVFFHLTDTTSVISVDQFQINTRNEMKCWRIFKFKRPSLLHPVMESCNGRGQLLVDFLFFEFFFFCPALQRTAAVSVETFKMILSYSSWKIR